jgi:hypothetical protein
MLTSQAISELSAMYGPLAYHYTQLERLPAILQHGLRPGHVVDKGNNHGVDEFEPRPGHTYFYVGDNGRARYPDTMGFTDISVALTIPLTAFDPTLINPDEDSFIGYNPDECEELGVQALLVPEKYSSYGEWAEQTRLGIDDIENTLLGISETFTFAYNGSIPPSLLTVMPVERHERGYLMLP